MTLGLFYVLLSTSTKIFTEKISRESAQTHEKHENLHPAKLIAYMVTIKIILGIKAACKCTYATGEPEED